MTRLVRFSNNAVSKLASSITNSSTTITLQAGDGAKFPALTGTQFFMGTMVKADGTTEIVKVTARSSDTLTVVRAAEAVAGVQTAYAFSTNDRFEHRLTATALSNEIDRIDSAAFIGTQNKSANYTITQADITSAMRFDTTSGNLTATLPLVSTLTDDFDCIVTKISADTNSLSIAISGSDTINGASTYTLTNQWQGAWLVADRSTNSWTVIASGSGGANPIVDVITGNGTPGPYTLSGSPGTKQNTNAFIGGAYQQKSSYTLSGNQITFGGNVPVGTTGEVIWTQPLQISVPADSSVTTPKIADASVTQAKLAANVAGNGPAFRAYRSAAFSSASGAAIPINCDGESFDTAGAFSNVFQPTVAGYYQITGYVQIVEGHIVRALILKNGAVHTYGPSVSQTSSVSDLVLMNGTTDTVSLGIADTMGSFNVTTGAAITGISGFLARAA